MKFLLPTIFLFINCASEQNIAQPQLHLVYSTTSTVGASNFTYFKLHKNGAIKVVLKTVEGDTDIYASSLTLYPDYNNYELKSATCGEDVIDIPQDMKRPVGIGVFGYPYAQDHEFELLVFASGDAVDDENQDYEESNKPSLLWEIFLGVLKLVVDILV